MSDPQGHSFGAAEEQPPSSDPSSDPSLDPSLDPARWCENDVFLFAVDLFNHGYYWEAHEAWEALWRAAGAKGTTADFFKGLIKLAAAGVKAREGRREGVRRHASRAAELLSESMTLANADGGFMGVELPPVVEYARHLAKHPAAVIDESEKPVVRVLQYVIQLPMIHHFDRQS